MWKRSIAPRCANSFYGGLEWPATNLRSSFAFLTVSKQTGGMTEGEITFHLREIIAAWTPPRITATTAAELERLNLIEFSDERRLVRLTPDGVQRKIAGRITTEDSTISSVPRRSQRRARRQPFAVRKLA